MYKKFSDKSLNSLTKKVWIKKCSQTMQDCVFKAYETSRWFLDTLNRKYWNPWTPKRGRLHVRGRTHTDDTQATPRTRSHPNVYSKSMFRAIAMVLDARKMSSFPVTTLVAGVKLRIDTSGRALFGKLHATCRINWLSKLCNNIINITVVISCPQTASRS